MNRPEKIGICLPDPGLRIGAHGGLKERFSSSQEIDISHLVQTVQNRSDTTIEIDARLYVLKRVQEFPRLLTGQSEQDIINDVGNSLADFRGRGHEIEIRRHLKINDRFIIFNGSCWMASCSLSEVDQTTLSIIECVDTKSVVVKEIGRRWREGKVYLG